MAIFRTRNLSALPPGAVPVGPQYEIADTGPRGGTVVSITGGTTTSTEVSRTPAPPAPGASLVPGAPAPYSPTRSMVPVVQSAPAPYTLTAPIFPARSGTSSTVSPLYTPLATRDSALVEQDRTLVSDSTPVTTVDPSTPQVTQREPASRLIVSEDFVNQLLQKYPQYFSFPDYAQGSVSTSAALESTTVDRTGIGGREVRTIEDMRAEAPPQKIAAYCVQIAPEDGASTGAMVPVDANCNCPEGFRRVGECAKPQSDSSKWWLWLLAGAGVIYWYRRK